ncbi:MAG: hypothetical protein GX675_05660 [Erysipelotrichaceae bacterium]|nr:hypothetical protein [Erysipelotrichaceae bacterium]
MSHTFTFDDYPKSKDDLIKLPEINLDSPFKTAALTVLVLLNYKDNVDKTIEMLNVLKGPQALSNQEISFLKDRIKEKWYVVPSFFEGSNPENDYKYNLPLKITIHEDKYTYNQKGYAKLLIQSSGADSKRPIVLREKDNKWYLWENMLLSDIRKPASLNVW